MIDPWYLIAFVLILILGYLLGSRQAGRSEGRDTDSSEPGREMVMGLNYLINDQTDAAIETFIQALQSHTDTVEPSTALAKLYCRRGELDKAVLICQQQLARPSLTQEENAEVLQALGEVYLQSGLLDRAESLFLEVVKNSARKAGEARMQLLRVYEKEQAWAKAQDIGKPLLRNQPEIASRLAHYCLAQAEAHFQATEYRPARKLLQQAQKYDRDSPRALLLQIKLDISIGRLKEVQKGADKLLCQPLGGELLSSQLADLLPSIFVTKELYLNWLKGVCSQSLSEPLLVAVSRQIAEYSGPEEGLEYLNDSLDSVTGVQSLVLRRTVDNLASQLPPECLQSKRDLLLTLKAKLQVGLSASYQCAQCGGQETHFEWRCRHCGSWSVVTHIMV